MSNVSAVQQSQDYIDFMKKYNQTTTQKAEAEAKASNTSDKDMFLNLMVTQMQYQDPLDPQDNSEYLAQMAQFTTLEIMENLGFSSEMSQANSMIGKIITCTANDGTELTGPVDGTKVIKGEVFLCVGDQDIELGKVKSVANGDMSAYRSASYAELTYANSLIGKIVTGTKVGDDGRTADFKAMVQSVKTKDGNIVLKGVTEEDIDIDITLGEIDEVTSMVDADEYILQYVESLYDIITQSNESANALENELADVTE